MTTTRATVHRNRQAPVTAPIVALVLSAIVDFANLGGYLSGAPIPPAIIAVWVALGLAALVAAGGLLAGRLWAARLANVVAAFTILLGVVGAITAGSMAGKSVSAGGAMLGLAVIALVTAEVARRANRW